MRRRVDGYGAWADRTSGKVVQEMDSVQCCHCQRHIFVKPGTSCTVYLIPDRTNIGQYTEEPGAWCRNCMKPVCLPCHDLGVCDPYLKKLERSERGTELRDALARLGRYVAGEPL